MFTFSFGWIVRETQRKNYSEDGPVARTDPHRHQCSLYGSLPPENNENKEMQFVAIEKKNV